MRTEWNSRLRVAIWVAIVVVLVTVARTQSAAHAQAAPAEYYVSQAGSDTNPGTQEQPFRTIQKAADVVQPGDTVRVQEGSYDERVFVNKSGTADSYITFEPAQGQQVVMRGFTIGQTPSQPQSYIRIRAFEITNTPNHWRDKVGISINGSHLRIEDNYIHHILGDGISPQLKAPHNDVVVRRNRIAYHHGSGINIDGINWLVEQNDVSHGTNITDGVAAGDTDATRFFGTGHVIRSNYFHDFLMSENYLDPQPHMDAFQTFDTASDVLIENNLVENLQGQYAMLNGSYGGLVSDITFRNNVLVKNAANGFYVIGVSHLTIVNNTFVDPRYRAIYLHGDSPHATVSNNIFYKTDGTFALSPYYLADATSTIGFVAGYNLVYPVSYATPPAPMSAEPHHRWGLNPRFINSVSGDFHLRADSAAKDSGTSDNAPSTDKDGNVRVDDPATPNTGGGVAPYYDLGAYESTDVTSPRTTLFVAPATSNGDNGWYATAATITLTTSEPATTHAQWDSTSPASWMSNPSMLSAPEGPHTLYYYSVDEVGNVEVTKSRAFKVDTGAPTDPVVAAASHTVGTWSTDRTVDLLLSGAGDSVSGVEGYSIAWSSGDPTLPDTTVDVSAATTSLSSPELSDGPWYFNLRTKDRAGNWSSTVGVGPYNVDSAQPGRPDVTSSTHPSQQGTYTGNDPSFTWSATDVPSGVDGYTSVLDRNATTVPGTTGATNATSAIFTDIADGTWYFHVRARDAAGNWGPAAHYRLNIDTLAPLAPTLLAALPGDGKVSLAWANPTSDFAATRVLRSAEGYATEPGAGSSQTIAYEGTGSAHLDDGLTNDTPYYYTAFARDPAGNWSMSSTIAATPQAPATVRRATLSLSRSKSTISYGQWLTLSGYLRDASSTAGIQTVAVPVRLERRLYGRSTWTTVTATVSTNGSGYYSYAFKPAYNAAYRAVWDGEGSYVSTASAAVSVNVRARISAAVKASVLPRGGTLVLSGAVAPAKRFVTLRVLTKVGRYWRRAGYARTNRYSRYAYRARLWLQGTRYYRVYFAGDSRNAAAYSGYVRVVVR